MHNFTHFLKFFLLNFCTILYILLIFTCFTIWHIKHIYAQFCIFCNFLHILPSLPILHKFSTGGVPLGTPFVKVLHRREPPLALRSLRFCTGGAPPQRSVRYSFAPKGALLGTSTKNIKKGKQKMRKMAITWLILSLRGCLMKLRLLKHEYLLAPLIRSDFTPFCKSESIIW